MKDLKKVLFGFGIIMLVLFGFLLYYFVFVNDYIYYVKIDNSKIEKISSNGGVFDIHGGMEYEYDLIMYDEGGKSKQIKFGTDRQLREGAFLEVKYFFLRGVYDWEEVLYDELPNKVKNKYS